MSDTTFPAIVSARRLPNLLDIAAMVVIFGLFVALVTGARSTLQPLAAMQATAIHLQPSFLPYYALRTTMRMFAALVCSLVFTFTYATWAAKSRRAGMILIPVLDILQSVPILGFLSFTVVFFMGLFPGRVLGAELAAIFAIFTSQAWNMAFSMYQSLTTLPADLDEAARAFHLSPWQRFWRLEVPFAVPGLVWNTMLSMSGGWFFVVASEAVSVGSTTWKLPGIGSYVALALEHRDIGAVLEAIGAMLVVILLYDQLLFRPLVAWSTKFRFEVVAADEAEDPWLLALLRRTQLLRIGSDALGAIFFAVSGMRLARVRAPRERPAWRSRAADVVWIAALAVAIGWAATRIAGFIAHTLHWHDLATAVLDGCFTLARVLLIVVVAAAIWVPLGVWFGLRPRWARFAQPVAQFLAAFPANLFFPIFVVVIVHFALDPDIWLTPLMLLGTQWYILFNVIAGAAAFPGDLKEVASNFRVGGFLWWRRVMLPGILPYLVTGAITASGNAWNTAIVAEVASWGKTNLVAHGLGAYIAEASKAGDTPRILLGVAVMSGFVLAFNRLLWRPLYAFSTRRMAL
ncbi:MAG TPA: ABC transporter permease subunit [Acetobacteraceae bacterium]|nr:ABC transporter permease subunit [Acetobacteraceae bacterium]